jgi:CubicO group peptidase (beta-lactamase class C family)
LCVFAEAQRTKHQLPALAVGMVREGRVIGLGVAGEAKLGSGDWATLDHRFDIGSCTKSFTATVAARLVEQGVIRWDTSVRDCFPEWAATANPDFRDATLETLLRHRSGLESKMDRDTLWLAWNKDHADQSASEQRRAFAAHVLSRAPRSKPGTEEFYTNDAYLVAAAMMEKAAGKPWEDCVRDLVIEPLALRSITFGAPNSTSGVSVMWGHNDGSLGRTRAIAPDPAGHGKPPFGTPAGFLSCTITDLLTWVQFHIDGENGGGSLLAHESFTRLHSALGDRG